MSKDFSYFHTFNVKAKQRWIKKPLLDVLNKEYNTHTFDYFESAISSGAITVNKKRVTKDYIITARDTVNHTIHLHEPAQISIDVISEHNDYLVVNKPAGIACHPTSHYNYFTITKILEAKYGILSCVNRLDIPTSGVLILVKNNLHYYHKLMKDREISKTYIAKVKGNVIDQTIDKKIESLPGKGCRVSENGKECVTIIRNIVFQNGYSLVECKPLTGRTHQIRVHLASIGHPIVNDRMYGGELICDKLKEADDENDTLTNKCLNKDKETTNTVEIVDGIRHPYGINHQGVKCNGAVTVDNEIENIFDTETRIDKPALDFILKTCEQENSKPYKNKDQYICLHAWKYKIDSKTHEAAWPSWAVW